MVLSTEEQRATGRWLPRLPARFTDDGLGGESRKVTPASMLDAVSVTCRARPSRRRQTRRYDRARGALDRNPTYIVATYLAGANRRPVRREASHSCRDEHAAVIAGGHVRPE